MVSFEPPRQEDSFAPNIAWVGILGAKKSPCRGGSNDAIVDHQFDHDQSTVGTLVMIFS